MRVTKRTNTLGILALVFEEREELFDLKFGLSCLASG